MSIDVQIMGNTARMKISDRFDSSLYKPFKHAYSLLIINDAVQVIEVDVSGVAYLDSAAMGMLVQLDESAKNARKSMALISVPGRVADILKLAHADKLFTINLPSGMKLDMKNQ